MTTKVNAFSPKQEIFISEYLLSGNITKSAKKAGVTKKSVYKWLNSGLEAEILERQKKIADSAIKMMQTATTEATEYLLTVLRDANASTTDKIKAADLLTRNGMKAYEADKLTVLADIEKKLEELTNED